MKFSNYFAILRIAGRFVRAYSKNIKAELAKDGDVSWWDRFSCVLAALESMDESEIEAIITVAKEAGNKK